MAEGNLKILFRILEKKGFPRIYLRECGNDLSSFSQALGNAVDNNTYGPYVDKITPEELRKAGAHAFLSRDKMAGVVVFPDGNIRAVFKDKRSRNQNAIGELMLTALSAGGNKLDCFDAPPLRWAYAMFGFIPVARVRFDWEYAPENWKKEFGEPDIIFWIHCGDPIETVAVSIADRARYHSCTKADIEKLPCFDSYEKACRYRDDQQAGNP